MLFLGDSFTEGNGVLREQTFVSLVENALERRPLVARVELLNLGRGGWDTERELQAFERFLATGFEIDAVVLVYFINDATGMNSTPRLIADLHDFVSSRSGPLNRISRVYDFFDYRFRLRRMTEVTLHNYRVSFLGDEQAVLQWERSKTALAEVARVCESRGYPLGVVLFPVLFQLDEEHGLNAIYELIEQACRALDLPFLNLLPAFCGQDDRSLWVSPQDAHPNAHGHALAAAPIEDFLVRHILPASRR